MRSPASLESFLVLLDGEPLAGATALDVGTGAGAVALALSARCRRVVGVDRDAGRIDEARRQAAVAGLANVEFVVADVEAVEYDTWAPDVVTARLCMSDAIVERAGRALPAGGVFAFVAFHTDHWRETGRPSRFAYAEERAAAVLQRAGFAVEHLAVAREVQRFGSVEEGLAAAMGLAEKWKTDGRWARYLAFLEQGGRTLTRSHLIGKARRRR